MKEFLKAFGVFILAAGAFVCFMTFCFKDVTYTNCGDIKSKYVEYKSRDNQRGMFDAHRYIMLDNGSVETVDIAVYMGYEVGQHICLTKTEREWKW
jgi:hypothetical protein